MKYLKFFFILAIKTSILLAQPFSAEMEKAKNYLDAKFYEQAIDIYTQLLNEPLTDEQKVVIEYNIATSRALQGDFSRAINEFDAINIRNLSPLLQMKILQNLALAHALFAIEMKNNQTKESKSDDSQLQIYHLKQAKNAIDKAIESECSLHAYLYKTVCRPSMVLIKLKNDIGVLLANQLSINKQEKITNKTLGQFLFLITSTTESFFDDLHFLQEDKFPKDLQKKYLQSFLEDVQNFLALWKIQEDKIEDEGILKLFLQAKNHYISMSNFAEKLDWDNAENSLQQGSLEVKNLIPLVFREQLFKNLLEELAFNYESAIENNQFDKNTIKHFEDIYSQIQELEKKDQEKDMRSISVQETIKKSFDRFQESQNFYRDEKMALAKFFLEDAFEWIKNALFDLDEKSVDKLMTKLLSQQSYSFKITENKENRLFENEADYLHSIAVDSQMQVLETAKNYFPLVHQEQVEKFETEGKCQSSPWSVALPLFIKGKNAAQTALNLLKEESFNKAMTFQEIALNAWKNSIEEMKNPKQDFCEQKSSNSQNSSKIQDSPLQLLHTMELDDQQSPKVSPLQETLKPW